MTGERVVIGGRMVLDANVVFPIAVADFLLTASTHGLLVPVLSPTVLDEARRNMIANLGLDEDRVDWRLSRVRTVVRGADIEPGPLDDADGALINPKDRHVLAAALYHDAHCIVTEDQQLLREVNAWRAASRRDCALSAAITPDDVAAEFARGAPDDVVNVIREMAARMKRPPADAGDVFRQLCRRMPSLGVLAFAFGA